MDLTGKSKKKIGRIILDYLYLFLISGVIIFLDQWSKSIVRATIPLGSDWLPGKLSWLMPYARFRHWYNTGAAFGFFKDGNLVFTILAIIVSIIIIIYFSRVDQKDWWLRLALSLQLAGAMGNLIDRLLFGHVTDFISVGNFAVFNIADSSISVGVAVLALGAILQEYQMKKKIKTQENGTVE